LWTSRAAEEGLIAAEEGVERASREKRLTDLSHAFRDRNPAVYESREEER
jgi:hypothetical protein